MKRSRDAFQEEDEKPASKKNKLLNPLIYDQWEEADQTPSMIQYESPHHIGIPVYSDHVDIKSLETHVLWKKVKDDKGQLLVKKSMEGVPIFDGKINITPNLSKEYPEEVRTSIIQLVRDIIGACSCKPQNMAAQNAVREVIEEGGKEIHYLYVIEYADTDSVLTLPIAQPSAALSPFAGDIELLAMEDGKMTFTFCVKEKK